MEMEKVNAAWASIEKAKKHLARLESFVLEVMDEVSREQLEPSVGTGPQDAEPDQMEIVEEPANFEARIAPDIARLEKWIVEGIAGWKWSIPISSGGRVGRSAILEYSKASKHLGKATSTPYIKTLREEGNWERVEWYDAPALAGYPATRKDERDVPYVRVWF